MHRLPIGLSLTPHPASVGQGGTIPALVQRAEHQTGRRARRTGAGWGGPGESSALPAAHPCSWQLSSTCSVRGGTRAAEQKIILRDPTAEQTPQPAPSPRARGWEPGSEPLQPEGARCDPPRWALPIPPFPLAGSCVGSRSKRPKHLGRHQTSEGEEAKQAPEGHLPGVWEPGMEVMPIRGDNSHPFIIQRREERP